MASKVASGIRETNANSEIVNQVKPRRLSGIDASAVNISRAEKHSEAMFSAGPEVKIRKKA